MAHQTIGINYKPLRAKIAVALGGRRFRSTFHLNLLSKHLEQKNLRLLAIRNTKADLISLFCFLLFPLFISAQPTIGVLQYTDESQDGYTFFSPFSGTKAWMVDNCGQLINSWSRGTRPGLSAYFLENGLMLRTYKVSPVAGSFNSASNAGGLELVDWEDNVVWSYEWNTPTELSHHDVVMMPNGHILMLTWELVYEDELIDLGRDPNEIASVGFMWSERIVEIAPIGSDDIDIIWEWRIKDHYIQNFDDTKLNFGVVSEHPELFNINFPELNSGNSHSSRDWNHFNAIDYHEGLDQILISTRNSDEIWIIDHSTTTQEAAGHTGGLRGRGGDILYRWGNPIAYNRGDVADQRFFGQHGTHWIKDGLEDAGKIMVFNNGNGRLGTDFSTIEILAPPQSTLGEYIIPTATAIGPEQSNIIYGDNLPAENFYSPFLSNAQRLTNGNTLINSGSNGHLLEINDNREIVWEYIIPLQNDAPFTQGWDVNNNWAFRAYKYSPDYAGFAGLDLTPGEVIEIGGNPTPCNLTTNTIEQNIGQNIQVHFEMNDQQLRIDNPDLLNLNIEIWNVQGQQVFTHKLGRQRHFLKILDLMGRFYVVSIRQENILIKSAKIVKMP